MNFLKLCMSVVVFATMIAAGSASAATCSNATVTGVWGYFVGASAGQFTADGKGNITSGSQTVSQNGVVSTQTYTGTYSLAKNCTGSININFTGGGTSSANIVADDANKGFQVISTDGGVASGFSLAQGVVNCGLTGKKATLAANLFGKIVNTAAVAYVSQVMLDGKGKISGSGTFVVNGTVYSGAISGTYTENADCTGTAQITPPSPLPMANFNFVVANGGKEIFLLETDPGTVVGGYMQQ